jgi:ubiquinone/menaquinone biosynthesis C-methylase UbiE
MQDKSKEKVFFDKFSAAKEYDVFTPYGYETIIKKYLRLIGNLPGKKVRVLDLGCGCGAFTRRFKEKYNAAAAFYGFDISLKSVKAAAELSAGIYYCAADIEKCCFKDETFDILLYSGVLHHFRDYETCLREGYRLLKAGGLMLSYDQNIKNPFMWLYRHPASPFFSKKGKTDNEQLLSTRGLGSLMKKAGFKNVNTRCTSGVTFRFVESTVIRFFLPLYNLFEILIGISPLAAKYGSFVIGYGEKP